MRNYSCVEQARFAYLNAENSTIAQHYEHNKRYAPSLLEGVFAYTNNNVGRHVRLLTIDV